MTWRVFSFREHEGMCSFLSIQLCHLNFLDEITWPCHVVSETISELRCRQLQALRELRSAIEHDEATLEEALNAHAAAKLTGLLTKTIDEELLDAVSATLAALSGAAVHADRLLEVTYPEVGLIRIFECPLGEGVGARLWSISHRLNLLLIEHRSLFQGKRALELGSGVGSSGRLPLRALAIVACRNSLLFTASEVLLRHRFTALPP
jgi:hypothetical protein